MLFRSLFDKLTDVASAEGPETDARPTIIAWLRDNSYTELADKYDQSLYTQDQAPLQQQPDAVAAQQAQATDTANAGAGSAEPSPAVNPAMQESAMRELRRLAGLKSK